jgi:hypothetical protein
MHRQTDSMTLLMEFIVRLVVAMSQSLPGKKKNSSMQQEE